MRGAWRNWLAAGAVVAVVLSIFVATVFPGQVEGLRGRVLRPVHRASAAYHRIASMELMCWPGRYLRNARAREEERVNGTRPETYYFTWSKVPGPDEARLRGFLMEHMGLDWAEHAEMTKSDDDESLNVTSGEGWAELRLGEERLLSWSRRQDWEEWRLKKLLNETLGLGWVTDATFEKCDAGMSLCISSGTNLIKITLSDDRRTATLQSDDGRSLELIISNNVDAYDLYLKGWTLVTLQTSDGRIRKQLVRDDCGEVDVYPEKFSYENAPSQLMFESSQPCESLHPGCQVPGNLCLRLWNPGCSSVLIRNLAPSRVWYVLPGARWRKERQLSGATVGVTFKGSGNETDVCCLLSDIGAKGTCVPEKQEIYCSESIIISFLGNYMDELDVLKAWRFDNALDDRMEIILQLASQDTTYSYVNMPPKDTR